MGNKLTSLPQWFLDWSDSRKEKYVSDHPDGDIARLYTNIASQEAFNLINDYFNDKETRDLTDDDFLNAFRKSDLTSEETVDLFNKASEYHDNEKNWDEFKNKLNHLSTDLSKEAVEGLFKEGFYQVVDLPQFDILKHKEEILDICQELLGNDYSFEANELLARVVSHKDCDTMTLARIANVDNFNSATISRAFIFNPNTPTDILESAVSHILKEEPIGRGLMSKITTLYIHEDITLQAVASYLNLDLEEEESTDPLSLLGRLKQFQNKASDAYHSHDLKKEYKDDALEELKTIELVEKMLKNHIEHSEKYGEAEKALVKLLE